MLLYYAGVDGVGKWAWSQIPVPARPRRLLNTYAQLGGGQGGKQRWVLRKILRQRRAKK